MGPGATLSRKAIASAGRRPRTEWLTCLCLCLMLAAIVPRAVQAQRLDYGAFRELFGEPVTTSVTGSPQRVSEVPATMTVITSEEIRRSGASDLPGLLRHVNGINVLRWTYNGADVSVRGYNQAKTPRLLVLLDGRQVYADHYGYTPWSTIPVELAEIQQIEIVKGPNSALFGFNAVGGVINIVTTNPLREEVNQVSVGAGTHGHREVSATTTLALGDSAAVKLSLGGRENDNFTTPQPTNFAIGTRRGDDRLSTRLDGHFALSSNVELGLEGSHVEIDQTNMLASYDMAFEDMRRQSLKADITADTTLGLFDGSVYRNELRSDVFLSDGSEPFVELENNVTVARAQHVFKPDVDHTLRVTGEYRDSELFMRPDTGASVFYDVLTVGGMWRWQITPALSMSHAIRRDGLDLGRKGPIAGVLGLSNADWDRRLNEWSFNSGLVWRADERNTFRVTAARGVQLPNLFTLGGEVKLPEGIVPFPLYTFLGLPDLETTPVTNYELGWERDLPSIQAALDASLFYGESRDVLSDYGRSPARNVLSAPINIGDSETVGLELSLDGELGRTWRWGVGYIYQHIDDRFDPSIPQGDSLTNFEDTTPGHVVDFQLGWQQGPWELDGYARYKSRFDGFRILSPGDDGPSSEALVAISDYLAVDARLGYRLVEGITVSLAGQNLLSSEQRQTSGPEVERRVQLRLAIDLQALK